MREIEDLRRSLAVALAVLGANSRQP